jgi:RNA polymerase sigma-70 factor (ECF subfamily)
MECRSFLHLYYMSLFRLRTYRKKTDEELLLLHSEKSSDLVTQVLYERYSHLVLGVSMKYLKNITNAEDLTSELFEQLDLKIRQHSIRDFKSWLHMVTRNMCLMRLRKKNPVGEMTDQLERSLAQEASSTEETEERLILLEKAMGELNPDQKNCIQAFYIDGKSYTAIAAEQKLDVKKVKSFIQNGKRNLKIKLEQEDEFKRAI